MKIKSLTDDHQLLPLLLTSSLQYHFNNPSISLLMKYNLGIIDIAIRYLILAYLGLYAGLSGQPHLALLCLPILLSAILAWDPIYYLLGIDHGDWANNHSYGVKEELKEGQVHDPKIELPDSEDCKKVSKLIPNESYNLSFKYLDKSGLPESSMCCYRVE